MERLSPPPCPTALPSTGPSASSLPVEGAGAAQGRAGSFPQVPLDPRGSERPGPFSLPAGLKTIKDPPQRRTGKGPAAGTHRGAPRASVLRLRQSPPRLVPAPSSLALHLLGSPRGRPVGGGGPGACLKEGLSCPFLPAPHPSECLGFETKRLLATAAAGRYASLPYLGEPPFEGSAPRRRSHSSVGSGRGPGPLPHRHREPHCFRGPSFLTSGGSEAPAVRVKEGTKP